MDIKEIQEAVFEIVYEQFGCVTDIDSNTTFASLNADSLDFIELIMQFEDEFDLEISDEEAEKIKTVGEAVNGIEKLLIGRDWQI